MALAHEPDVSHAAWLTDRIEPWEQLCAWGPPVFAAAARLFHGDPGDPPDPGELMNLEGDLDDDQLRTLVEVLARHTTTRGDCFFGLWDGFGDIEGGTPPGFAAAARAAPRVRIPGRTYLLFRGPLADAGVWGAAELTPGWPRRINSPNLMWPADHAWFVATEIDLPWTGVGGSEALVADLLAEPGLDAERAEPGPDAPYWRA